MKIEIGRGAEAILIHSDGKLLKKRIKKGYRNEKIDDILRKLRTRKEAKIMQKAGLLISVPKIFEVNEKINEIKMEFIDGEKLSDYLEKYKLEKAKIVCKKIGENIARLHNSDIIHGDLTTSNMIFSKKEIYFIDFGLSFISQRKEDKAVDLHLLKQALESKHFKNFDLFFEEIIDSYKEKCIQSKEILMQFDKVENRGRYKQKKISRKTKNKKL